MLGIPEEEWGRFTGFLVEKVQPRSAGDTAGLRGGRWPTMWGGNEILLGGDIITEANGIRITEHDQALDVVRRLKVGARIDLVYLRNGNRITASVVLPERPLIAEEMEIHMRRQ
ncbi:PDZ domain-containing protein [Thetidibacter halocola]|uniref:PDZ domain-containing protein n=1 Tax=Thetidibacter halocola TaxID=2827239 RepID=A0A8J7WG00_9RHOB|nr:PDZ domain-containing protein [Thetidibacter halocola]MBS0125684.1 PDZ domain-containing protein [Thetidibacter halocola]